MKLPSISTIEITLPESGAKCNIGFTYGDRVNIRNSLMRSVKYTIGEDGKTKSATEISGEDMLRGNELLMTTAIKSWEFEVPVTWENIQALTPKDGEFLFAEIDRISKEELDKESKKK